VEILVHLQICMAVPRCKITCIKSQAAAPWLLRLFIQ